MKRGMWNLVSEDVEHEEEVVPASMAERVWRFQGLFHPATTHFPIALLTVSAGFVFLSFFRPDTCEPVAFHCLWIGALGAVVASAAGWSYAVYEGYGAGFSFDLFNSAIDRHRWLGIAVALVSMLLIPVAMYVRRTEDFGMRFIWFVGSLLLLAGVGLVGYQGGELTYGEGHYEKEFVKLFPEAFAIPNENDADADADASQAEKNEAEESGDEVDETVKEDAVTPADSAEEVVVEVETLDPEADTAEPDQSDEPALQADLPQADDTDASPSSESAVEPTSDEANSNDASALPPAVVQPLSLPMNHPSNQNPQLSFSGASFLSATIAPLE
ncbi:MAG: DUF2231 domain-containing protein [Pirellulaceae bacterium]